jgi:hypothetical protein
MNIHEIPKFGIVYKLSIDDAYYIGSTLKTIHCRIAGHQAHYRSGDRNECKLFKYIAEHGGWDAVKVEIIETMVPEAELRIREDSLINLMDPLCLNTRCAIFPFSSTNPVIPDTPPSPRDSCKKHTTEKQKEYHHKYYEKRKEEIKAYRMEYYYKLKQDPERYAAVLKGYREARARRLARKKAAE